MLSAGVVVLCVLLARRLDLDRLLLALKEADVRLVVLAGIVNLTINTAARVGRWHALLDPLPHTGSGARRTELAALYFASQAASNLLPARAGEALRVVHLHRRHGYDVSGLVAVQLLEVLVGAVTLGAFTLPMVPLGQAPASLSAPIVIFALAGPVGMILLVWLARIMPGRAEGEAAIAAEAARTSFPARVFAAVRGIVWRMVEAVRQIHAPRVWARSLAWSVLSDISDVIMIGLVLAAVGVHLSPARWAVIYAAINLVLLLPTTPAQLGVLEVGAVAALRAFDVDEHAALAFALLYHASHVIPPTVVGALFLPRLDLRRAAADPPPDAGDDKRPA
ncbi:MAG: lysylphosphatidylglycerol synthase transmembrane domain-containing protein [Minicystis sp.]